MDESLVNYLKDLDIIESNDSRLKKILHVHLLDAIAREWVLKISEQKNILCPNSNSYRACAVLIHGSTSLGVSFKESDIDAVLVTPNFINREDFFGSFANILRRRPNIRDLLMIPDTFVPLIKMKIEGTPVDLVLSRLTLPYVPFPLMFYEKPEIFYYNVDHYSVHGLSGLHLAQKFREIVPEFSLFTDLLKIIKTWASQRLINDYVYGYPASVAWAVLCAYICRHTGFQASLPVKSEAGLLDQSVLLSTEFVNMDLGLGRAEDMYDEFGHRPASVTMTKTQLNRRKADGTLTALVQIFFTYFSHWIWPSPVIIGPVVSVPELRLYSWDSKNDDFMPIITPIYPHKNAAYTVRRSSRDIIVKELQRAHQLVKEIIHGSAKWADLFEPYNICQDHKLTVDSYQELIRLGGLVDSRLRYLASNLEEHPYVRSVRITKLNKPHRGNNTCAEDNSDGDNCLQRTWLLGLDIVKAPLSPDGSQGKREVDVTEYLIRFYDLLQEKDSGRTDFLSHLVVSYLTRFELQSEEC